MARYEEFSVGDLTYRALRADSALSADVTQATSRSTGVAVDGIEGAITTDDASLAAGATVTFTVTNASVQAGSLVLVALQTVSTTAISVPFVTAIEDGSFDITLYNTDAATADTSASVIRYTVLNPA